MTTKPRRKADATVQPRTITNATSSGTYSPTWRPLRAGADAHERYPSRQSDVLVYRDGRREPA